MRCFALTATVLAVACAGGAQFPAAPQCACNGQGSFGPSCLSGACDGGCASGMNGCDPCLGPCCSPYLPTPPPSAPPATTTKVHILLIGMTRNASSAESVKADLKTMQGLLETGISEARRYPVKILEGDAVTAPNVLAEVDKLNVKFSEAVFCYYSGHGGYETGKAADDPSGGHYFSLPEGALFEKELNDHLRNKRARLTVLFTETPSLRVPLTSQDGLKVLPEMTSNPVLTSLLFRYKGALTINGNSRDQRGWGDQKGGVFTLAFRESCDPKRYANPEFASWPEFVDKLADTTDKRFHKLKAEILKNDKVRNQIGIEPLKDQADQKPQPSQVSVEF